MKQITLDGLTSYKCSSCGKSNSRAIIIDPKIEWWRDSSNTYWHKSVGILLVNEAAAILLFELTKYPYGFTVPAGHVDKDETPAEAVVRETMEEVGLKIENPTPVIESPISNDSCRRGADNHLWSLFVKKVSSSELSKLKVDEREGVRPTWVELTKIDSVKMTPAVKFIFSNYMTEISDAIK